LALRDTNWSRDDRMEEELADSGWIEERSAPLGIDTTPTLVMLSEFDRAHAKENESKHPDSVSPPMLTQGVLPMLFRENALVRH
jgi:hypothetical protein